MTPKEMDRLDAPIRRVGVVLRAPNPETQSAFERLRAYLEVRGISVAGEGPGGLPEEGIDLLVSLGGDGTLLRAARSVVGRGVPVLGVNLGRLGFLTAFPDTDMEDGLGAVLSGQAYLDMRFALRGAIVTKGKVQGGNFFGLNDIVVHTSGVARVTPLTLEVRGGRNWEEVGTFGADGVILSTPTGSTAYSMSAGGPILVPGVDCIVVTPICPHSLAVRPLVIPANSEVRVSSPHLGAAHQVTVDGQVERGLGPEDSVVVAREEQPVPLVRLPGQTFFSTMRTKLNWAARSPERK